MLTRAEPLPPLRVGRAARWRAEARIWARAHSSLISAIAAVFVSVLALEFVRPTVLNGVTMRASVETAMTLLALAAAWLLRARFVHSRRLRDLLLVAALVTLGLIHFCWQVMPATLDVHSESLFTAATQWGQLFVAAIFAAAALVGPDHSVPQRGSAVAFTAGLSAAVIAVSALVAVPAGPQLAGVVPPAYGITGASHHPLALVLVLGATALFATAAWGFHRRQRSHGDGVISLLAGGVLLLAAARFSYTAAPSLAVDMIAPRDVVSVLAFCLFFAAGVRQELQARSLLAQGAAMAERQRLARDLHDGLAQDLAFIAAHGERIAAELGDQHPVVIAARRALAISRTAIAQLSDPAATTVQESLEAVAHELRGRFDISIAVDAQPAGELPTATQEDLSRIAREAIANAARHGGAKNVMVSVSRSAETLRLRVCDDGCGIQNAARAASHEGFGLRSMQERAQAAGGHMTIRNPGSGGTELEIVLP